MTGLRIAMIGQRSLPANYGGVERAVEELGARLAERGHEVTVYCYAADQSPSTYRGMHLVRVPALPGKHLRAFTQAVWATVLALRGNFDIVHFHAMGPSMPAPLLRLRRGSRIVSTVQGRDDKRAKWNPGAQFAIRQAARLMARLAERTIVVSEQLAADYQREFNCRTVKIPNGVMAPLRDDRYDELAAFGLSPRGYLLNVGRLVPEKAVDLLIDSYRGVEGDMPLVIVGGSANTASFSEGLAKAALADPRVRILGEQHDETLRQLFQNARGFVFPSKLEGLPIVLLEAAAFGLPMVSSDIGPATEVLGTTSAVGIRLFPSGDGPALTRALEALLADPLPAALADVEALRTQVLSDYSWDVIADRTEELYRDVVREIPRGSGQPVGP